MLIVGGYGVVGHHVAAEIGPEYRGRVIVAGRNLERAEAAAATIGHGVRARTIDIDNPTSIATALRGVSTVLSCIDQRERLFLRAAVERGLRYTDITPHLTELGRGLAYEQLDAAARAAGACLDVPRTGTMFALRVDVRYNGRTRRATLIGPAQAYAAAAGAVGVLNFLLDTTTIEPGAWMPEQVIDPEPFFSRLAVRGLRVTIAE